MTAFEDKLKTARKDPLPSIYSKEYKEQIWTLLLAVGGAVEDRGGWHGEYNYYGGRLNFDAATTAKVAEVLNPVQGHADAKVDWEACGDPAQKTETEFVGTFADYDSYVHFFVGDLVLTNGDTYRWGAMSESDDFGGLIYTITSLDITYEDAVEELVDRCTREYGLNEYYGSNYKIPLLFPS